MPLGICRQWKGIVIKMNLNRGKVLAVVLSAVGACLAAGCADGTQEEASVAVLQPQPLKDISDVTEPSSSFRQAYDEAEDESYFFANVYDIFSSDDMTLVNLEGPLTLAEEAREGQVYSIKGDPRYADILTAGSVEAVSLGNNHMMDYLEQGRNDTVQAVEEAGIVYAYEKTVGIYEVKGIHIGMISVNEVSQGYHTERDRRTAGAGRRPDPGELPLGSGEGILPGGLPEDPGRKVY